MSQDGKSQAITRIIRNDRPNRSEVTCPCGGLLYSSAHARFATCSGGEVRCTICLRRARRFGKGYTCGVGCTSHG